MNFLLAIYDSTKSQENTFWRFRHKDLPLTTLDLLYYHLSVNSDNTRLSEIGVNQFREGIAYLDGAIGFLYRVYATKTPRYETIVFALGFDKQESDGIDLCRVWKNIPELDQYIEIHLREDGTIRTPLQHPDALEFITSCAKLPPNDKGGMVFSPHFSRPTDLHSTSHLSSNPNALRLYFLQRYSKNYFFIFSAHLNKPEPSIHYILYSNAALSVAEEIDHPNHNTQQYPHNELTNFRKAMGHHPLHRLLSPKNKIIVLGSACIILFIGAAISRHFKTKTDLRLISPPPECITEIVKPPVPVSKRIYLGDSSVGRCRVEH